MDRIEVVQEDKNIIELNARIKKVNKIRSIVGYVIYNVPFVNDIKIEIKTLKKQGGEYRYMPYKLLPGPFCDVLVKDKYFYPDVARHSDLPEDIMSNCPLPAVSQDFLKIVIINFNLIFLFKGNYSINGITTNLENLPIAVAQTGEYCGEMTYYKDNQKVAIYRAYAYINNV